MGVPFGMLPMAASYCCFDHSPPADTGLYSLGIKRKTTGTDDLDLSNNNRLVLFSVEKCPQSSPDLNVCT